MASRPEADRPGITRPEIAARYERSAVTVDRWCADPTWPAPIGKRGRYLEYDPEQVALAVAQREPEPAPAPLRGRLSRQEIAEHYNIEPPTVRSYAHRGHFGEPDEDGRYSAADVAAYMSKRRVGRPPGSR